MADKATGKKKQQQQQQQQQHHHQQQQQPQQQHQQQQQKNKKNNQPGKKKNDKNGIKYGKQTWLISPKYADLQGEKFMKRKKKNNKNIINHNNNNNIKSSNNNNINKSSKKKSEPEKGSFLWIVLIHLTYVSLILGFIYIVDYEKFVRIRDGASYYVNKTASLLPAEVLTKGKKAVEFIQPVVDVTVNKATVLAKETSSFLNTNPLVKDHWTNIREISLICNARLVDYMRTLYIQITGFCNDVKTKFF